MAQTFAERFKGKTELFSKEGMPKITVPSGHPVNLMRQYSDPSQSSAKTPLPEVACFSRNAQTNILDFQKRYQPMLAPEPTLPVYSDTDPGFNHVYRGVYSAFDPSRPPHPHNYVARKTDGYLHSYGSDNPTRNGHEPFEKRSSLTMPGDLVMSSDPQNGAEAWEGR